MIKIHVKYHEHRGNVLLTYHQHHKLFQFLVINLPSTKNGTTPHTSTQTIPHIDRSPKDAMIASSTPTTPACANITRVVTQSPPAVTKVAYITMIMMVKAKYLRNYRTYRNITHYKT